MTDNSIASLPRQSGLLQATDIIANNIANASTPGYKAESTVFAEYVAGAGNQPSLSMGHLVGHTTDFTTGAVRKTGNPFDLAISGGGYFKVQTPQGDRLTRAGIFQLNQDGQIIDPMGQALLDDGGAPVEIPPDAKSVSVARDGTLSIDGQIFGTIGVFEPQGEMRRAGSNLWEAVNGDRVVEEPKILQGFVEQSNVSPVAEFAKLIMAQRYFEAGQTLTEQEHERLSSLIKAIRQG
ncbi:MAG: flagellar hook-basal body complex protein [Parvularcula sp.]